MEWITSDRYFGAQYDFAIIADQEVAEFHLPREQLTAFDGEPVHSVRCGDRSVLLFGLGACAYCLPFGRPRASVCSHAAKRLREATHSQPPCAALASRFMHNPWSAQK